MVKDQTINKDSYLYMIAMLKILMSFVVVVCHFDYSTPSFSGGIWTIVRCLKPIAVPTFAVLSVYFMDNTYSDWNKIKSRIERLLIPHVVWSVIYIVFMFFILQYRNEFTWWEYIKNSIFQIFFGSTYNGPAWFQVDLIVITIALFLLYRKYENRTVDKIVGCVGVLALVSQYTGLNRSFLEFLPYGMEGTIGRLIELLPYVYIGLMLKKYKNLIIQFGGKKINILVCAFFALVCVCFQENIHAGDGYNYNGVGIMITTIIIVNLFYMLPDSIFSKTIRDFIRYVAAHTMGVYFVQYLVGYILAMLFTSFHAWHDVTRCMVVYLVSFGVCVLISKVPYPFAKKIIS